MKGMRQRQMNLMRVDYVFQDWLQTTQEILKFIANRQTEAHPPLLHTMHGRGTLCGLRNRPCGKTG